METWSLRLISLQCSPWSHRSPVHLVWPCLYGRIQLLYRGKYTLWSSWCLDLSLLYGWCVFPLLRMTLQAHQGCCSCCPSKSFQSCPGSSGDWLRHDISQTEDFDDAIQQKRDFKDAVVVWVRCPHILRHLNAWFPVGGPVWVGLGSVWPCWRKNATAGGLWGFTAMCYSDFLSLLPVCGLSKTLSSQLPATSSMNACCILSWHDGDRTLTLWNCELPNNPPMSCFGHGVLS